MALALCTIDLFTKSNFALLRSLHIIGTIKLDFLKELIDLCPSDILEELALYPFTSELFADKNVLPSNLSSGQDCKEFSALKSLEVGFNEHRVVSTSPTAFHPVEIKEYGNANGIAILPYIDAKQLSSFTISYYTSPNTYSDDTICFWETLVTYLQRRHRTIKTLKMFFNPHSSDLNPSCLELGPVIPEALRMWTRYEDYPCGIPSITHKKMMPGGLYYTLQK